MRSGNNASGRRGAVAVPVARAGSLLPVDSWAVLHVVVNASFAFAEFVPSVHGSGGVDAGPNRTAAACISTPVLGDVVGAHSADQLGPDHDVVPIQASMLSSLSLSALAPNYCAARGPACERTRAGSSASPSRALKPDQLAAAW